MTAQAQTTPKPTAIVRAPQQVLDFQQFFEVRKASLAQVMPKVLKPERVMKVVLAAYARTPALWNCTFPSVYEAIQQAVQLGLEPGSPLGHAYLVPYGNQCTLIVGYKGLIALARRSGEIATIEAHVVHEGDNFAVRFGTDSKIEHEPNFTAERNDDTAKAVYAIATLRDGSKQWEVMSIADVNKIRSRSRASQKGPWVTDYLEMARKTVVRRLCKYLPLSIEMADAIEQEERHESDAAIDITGLVATPDSASADEAVRQIGDGATVVPMQPAVEQEKAELTRKATAKKPTLGVTAAGFIADANSLTNLDSLEKLKERVGEAALIPADREAVNAALAAAEARIERGA